MHLGTVLNIAVSSSDNPKISFWEGRHRGVVSIIETW